MASFSAAIQKQLATQDVVLVVLPKATYSQRRIDLAVFMQKKDLAICYVSVNTPSKKLRELLKSAGLDDKKLKVIDCVTGGIAASVSDANTTYLSSPKDMTGLGISIGQIMKDSADCLVVDSISTFVLYNNPVSVARFAHSAISRLRVFDQKGLFIITKDEASHPLYDDLCMLVDGVVEIK